MQQLGFDSGVRTHGQRQLPLWSGQATRALDQLAPQGAKLCKFPQWCAAISGSPRFGQAFHLHLPVQIVGQHGGEHIDLVAGEFSSRDIIHLSLRFQLGEQALLCATAVVVGQHMSGRYPFVGHDDLEVVAVLVWHEEVQLHGLFVLHPAALTNTDEAVASAPALGLPGRLEEAPAIIESLPALAIFDQRLQCCKAGKWHADGELHTERLEPADGGIAEEGAVHAHFNHAPGLYGTHLLDTGLNKVLCAVAVILTDYITAYHNFLVAVSLGVADLHSPLFPRYTRR